MSASLIDRVRERLAAESVPLQATAVAAAIRAESGGLLGDAEVLSSLRLLQTELTGAGVLDPLLRAEGTTDVLVTGPDAVWIDDGNGLRRSSVRFADDDAVRRLAQRLALSAGRRLDDAQPWVDGQLIGLGTGQFSVRLHAVLSSIAPGGTCLSLRVLRPATQDLAALIRTGTIEPAAAALLDDIIGARLAFLVSGGTGAGKTTLLAAALGAVPAHERIVCVEDAAELEPAHPHLVKLVARPANVEGVGEVTVRDLVKQALRMRPDRIVVGEVRGAEVVDLLGRAQHRSRRRRGDRARQQPGRGACPSRSACRGRRARPRCAAQSARRRRAGARACQPRRCRPTPTERDRGPRHRRRRQGPCCHRMACR